MPKADWEGLGTFEVKLTITDTTYTEDLFYFCHIHAGMSGRIKVVDSNGDAVNDDDTPELGYDYEVPSDYDASCGTYGVGDYTADAHALFVLRRVRPNAPPRDHALRWWHAWALERGLADPDAKSPDASPTASPAKARRPAPA